MLVELIKRGKKGKGGERKGKREGRKGGKEKGKDFLFYGIKKIGGVLMAVIAVSGGNGRTLTLFALPRADHADF